LGYQGILDTILCAKRLSASYGMTVVCSGYHMPIQLTVTI